MGDVVFHKSAVENFGEWFVWGAARAIGKLMLFGLLLMVGAGTAIDLAGRAMHLGPPDDSDGSWSDRSGVRPRRDALTGCEYLESSEGVLTPRLAASGRQVCRPK